VAESLAASGAVAEALGIAEHGLSLARPRAALARWLRDRAAESGRMELAITAGKEAFREDASLADYHRMREVANEGDERWPALREELLEILRSAGTRHQPAQVDVFLEEGLVEDAIGAVDGSSAGYMASFQHGLLRRVADAAKETHPDWVLPTCRRQAEQIMNEGRSQHYAEAAEWLSIAREASRVSGQLDEWRAYMEELLQKHARKYRLMPLLRQAYATV
jgi:uncharacterized Zn finger protein